MKISIVTATFNSGGTVRDTLESVLGQTFCDYESMVVRAMIHSASCVSMSLATTDGYAGSANVTEAYMMP